MTLHDNGLRFLGNGSLATQVWEGPAASIAFDAAGIKEKLLALDQPCYFVGDATRIGVTNAGQLRCSTGHEMKPEQLLLAVPPLPPQRLGDPAFLAAHGARYPYMTGSMAHAISGEDLVIALGKAGILASFGAGGLAPARVETAIRRIQAALPQGPYAFNLLHSPGEPALEEHTVNLYLKYGVTTVEAAAFIALTPAIVRYRVAGLGLDAAGQIEIQNRVMAKVSRREVATRFLQPPPAKIIRQLREQNLITELQATLAEKIPMADDITVEADSGGHTDNRPLVCILPSIIALRDELQEQYDYPQPVRIGAAGGIGTPSAVLGAFMMGAAYVMTGSVNHACVEAGASQHTKKLLSQAATTDVMMAPAADMFEMGVQVQVLKRGTLFPMRARKLFELYKTYASLEDIPAAEREKLEQRTFQRSLESVWEECVAFFGERDPAQLAKAARDPRRKMALIFRWYLGRAAYWSITGEKGREADYQIWCGPAMGAFNDWTRGSYLAEPGNRHVADVAQQLLTGAAFLYRLQSLKLAGLQIPAYYRQYRPVVSSQ